MRLLFLSLTLVFCAGFAISVTAQSGNIRSVDFKNFTYQPSCAYDKKPVRTRNGEYSRERGDDKIYFKITGPVYGDLNGDGNDEAVITSTCNTGGTGNFTEGFVFTMSRARPILLTRIEGGDRAFGGIAGAHVARGLLVVERYAPNESGGGACCPEYIETSRYRWNGRRLIQVGKTTKRKYEPSNS